jgi:hypothetical protein
MSDRTEIYAVALAAVVAFVVTACAVYMAATARPSTAGSFMNEPTCAEWSDGCIVCQRTQAGTMCSTPGIACVPVKTQCLRRDGA